METFDDLEGNENPDKPDSIEKSLPVDRCVHGEHEGFLQERQAGKEAGDTGHVLLVCPTVSAQEDMFFCDDDKGVVDKKEYGKKGKDDDILGQHADPDGADEAEHVQGMPDDGIGAFRDQGAVLVPGYVQESPETPETTYREEKDACHLEECIPKAVIGKGMGTYQDDKNQRNRQNPGNGGPIFGCKIVDRCHVFLSPKLLCSSNAPFFFKINDIKYAETTTRKRRLHRRETRD